MIAASSIGPWLKNTRLISPKKTKENLSGKIGPDRFFFY